MQNKLKKKTEFSPEDISSLLKTHYAKLMASFYETQSDFLSGIYRRYGSIETANIILFFARNRHLEIIRQKERNLNFNISLNNFWDNFQNIPAESKKITSVVKCTAIPKETVRRKVKNLIKIDFLSNDKDNKGFYWNLTNKHRNDYIEIVNKEIKMFTRFLSEFANNLGLRLNHELIEEEIKLHFSFYWYHFLSCQLEWLKMFQIKLQDNELLLIVLQAIIPTLRYSDKKISPNLSSENIFKIIGEIDHERNLSKTSISASTIAQITGIPRATCIRKLEKLVSFGFLMREEKSKKYFINQNTKDRTKNIVTKEVVSSTIGIFSSYISIILNSLIFNQRK